MPCLDNIMRVIYLLAQVFKLDYFLLLNILWHPTMENYMPPPSRLIVTLQIKTKEKKNINCFSIPCQCHNQFPSKFLKNFTLQSREWKYITWKYFLCSIKYFGGTVTAELFEFIDNVDMIKEVLLVLFFFTHLAKKPTFVFDEWWIPLWA